jgi:uncharacterized protein (DUF2236 family)
MSDQPGFKRPSIRAEVATAFRRIGAEFNRLPPEVRDSLDLSWNRADALLDRELLDGDRSTAIAAIRAFENHYFDIFESLSASSDNGGARPDPRTAV